MPVDDAIRWNQRYLDEYSDANPRPRSLLVEHSDWLPDRGLALDIAMGLGGNAHFLVTHGLRVIGVDISSEAVYRAIQSEPNIMAVIADMEQFIIPRQHFDLIIDFLYLQKDLWQSMTYGLRIGGLLFIELLTEEILTIHPETKPDNLVRRGELCDYFSAGSLSKHLQILYDFEGWVSTDSLHPRSVSSLVARRVA